MDIDSKNLSFAIINRVRVWEEALRKSYSYLLAIEKLDSFGIDESDYIKYQIGQRWANFHKGITINSALLEASIIHFESVFSIGYSGDMMADNKNKEIDKLRNEIVEKSILELKWTRDEYNQVFEKIKVQRDSLLAHYDGNVGDYKKISEGIYSRKMVGANLFPKEISKFKDLLSVLLEKTFKIAYS